MTYACSVRRAFDDDDDDRDACGRTRRRFRCVTNLIFASILLRPRPSRDDVAAAADDGFDAMGVVVNDARIVIAFVSIGFGFVRRRVALETTF